MKRIISLGLIAIFAVVVLSSLTPKKKKKSKQFRGTITYAISYDSDELSEVQKTRLPKTLKVKMYDGMSMFDEVMGPVVQTTLIKPDADKYIVMVEYGMKKAAITKKYSEMTNDSLESFTTQIDFSSDTKIIAGYTCKKAVVTFTPKDSVDAEEQMYSVYYTSELGSLKDNKDSEYEGIDGMLMEFYQVTPKMIVKMEVTEVIKGKIKELEFYMPDDYKEFTDAEELQKYLIGE